MVLHQSGDEAGDELAESPGPGHSSPDGRRICLDGFRRSTADEAPAPRRLAFRANRVRCR
jgi:hypothetical protein